MTDSPATSGFALARIYAPKSAAKIDEAAHLIRKAAHLLDNAGDRFVIAEIEKIPGSGSVSLDLAKALEALAQRLEQ